MKTLLATLFLTLHGCGGVTPDDTGTPNETGTPDDTPECTAPYDSEGTVPITFKTWDPADPCGTFTTVTEEHDAAYWGDWRLRLECYDTHADDEHHFTDATGRCIYFGYSVGWEAFEDPWLVRLDEGHPCRDYPGCG